jgi:hypothetical protein
MSILWWAIVGIVAGFLTGKIMSGAGYGILHDIGVGDCGRDCRRIPGDAIGPGIAGWIALYHYYCGAGCDAGHVHRAKDSRIEELTINLENGEIKPHDHMKHLN